jgi:hypothetical protein
MKERCIVLVPVAGHIEPACEQGLQALEAAGYTVWRQWGFSEISLGRSRMATAALADGFTELMWIDSDIVFEPSDVDRLRRHELPIVAGIYVAKGRQTFICTPLPSTTELVFGRGGGVIELQYVGAGFLLTRRSVYDRIQEAHQLPRCEAPDLSDGAPDDPGIVPYFLPMIHENRFLTEDYSFCERARACGHQVMADTTIRLGHVGSYAYAWDRGQDADTVRFPIRSTRRA